MSQPGKRLPLDNHSLRSKFGSGWNSRPDLMTRTHWVTLPDQTFTTRGLENPAPTSHPTADGLRKVSAKTPTLPYQRSRATGKAIALSPWQRRVAHTRAVSHGPGNPVQVRAAHAVLPWNSPKPDRAVQTVMIGINHPRSQRRTYHREGRPRRTLARPSRSHGYPGRAMALTDGLPP